MSNENFEAMTLLMFKTLNTRLDTLEKAIHDRAECGSDRDLSALQAQFEELQKNGPRVVEATPVVPATAPINSEESQIVKASRGSELVKIGARFMTRSGNKERFPVEVVSGPHLVEGEHKYVVHRIDDGRKSLGMRTEAQLISLTKKEYERWSNVPLPEKKNRSSSARSK